MAHEGGFSVVSVVATCDTLLHRSLSGAVDVDEILQNDQLPRAIATELTAVSRAFLAFRRQVEQLGAALQSTAQIAPELQQSLAASLRSCDDVAAVLGKQVKRFGPQTNPAALDLGAIKRYKEFLSQYETIFVMQTDLLKLESVADQTKQFLALPQQHLLSKAEKAAQAVRENPDLLSDVDRPGLDEMAAAKLALDSDLPPSFDEAVASPTSPGSSRGESSNTGGNKFFSSIANGFKAVTAAMRPKPEPFVMALCQAAARGDVSQIKGFMNAGVNINGRNEEGNTALIAATLANEVAAVMFLLDSGADHTISDNGKKSRPPFFHAVDIGSRPMIEVYLTKGVDINQKNMYGQAYFSQVVTTASLDVVRLLLERGANSNATDLVGSPIVVLATKKGDLPLVRLLLEFGATANVRDASTGNPVHVVALSAGHDELFKLFLSYGADPNAKTITGTPIILETYTQNKPDLLRRLLERGATPNCKDIYGTSFLSLVLNSKTATKPAQVQLIRQLLSYGADTNASEGYGKPPLLATVLANHSADTLKLFLEHGANPNAKLPGGSTLLLDAVDENKWDAALNLLRHGANPNETDKTGRTPMVVVILKRNPEFIDILLQHGADANKLGAISPLAIAHALGDAGMQQRLRLYGAVGTFEDAPRPVPTTRPNTNAAEGGRAASPPPGYEEAASSS